MRLKVLCGLKHLGAILRSSLRHVLIVGWLLIDRLVRDIIRTEPLDAKKMFINGPIVVLEE